MWTHKHTQTEIHRNRKYHTLKQMHNRYWYILSCGATNNNNNKDPLGISCSGNCLTFTVFQELDYKPVILNPERNDIYIVKGWGVMNINGRCVQIFKWMQMKCWSATVNLYIKAFAWWMMKEYSVSEFTWA